MATQDNYLEFYHKCLGLILEELLHLESLPYGIPFRLADKRLVHLHFRLSMIMGDTKGHEDMCCHFNSHSSNIKRMVRDCNVSQLCGDDVNHICEFTKQAEVRAIVLSSIEAVKKRDNVTAARDAASEMVTSSSSRSSPTACPPSAVFVFQPSELRAMAATHRPPMTKVRRSRPPVSTKRWR